MITTLYEIENDCVNGVNISMMYMAYTDQLSEMTIDFTFTFHEHEQPIPKM